jgi:hypothetical protein
LQVEFANVEKAAIDRAIANGVIVVASAGNEGDAGMGFPGAYAPVISAAAAGQCHNPNSRGKRVADGALPLVTLLRRPRSSRLAGVVERLACKICNLAARRFPTNR